MFNVGLPAAPQPNQLFTIDYTTQTDQQLKLSSMVVPAGGLPCGQNVSLFSEAVNQASDDDGYPNLFGEDFGEHTGIIFGGPLVSQASLTEDAAGP